MHFDVLDTAMQFADIMGLLVVTRNDFKSFDMEKISIRLFNFQFYSHFHVLAIVPTKNIIDSFTIIDE